MSDCANKFPNSIHLTCKDTTAALAFYRDVLGFQLDGAWPDEANPMWASLSLNGQVVMLGSSGDCEPDCGVGEFHTKNTEAWKKAPGGGVFLYLHVSDVDEYCKEVKGRGAKIAMEPKDEFYGLRNFAVNDSEGYCLVFYQPIQMKSCQSCGMPLAEAQPGQMYCQYCTDDAGKLKSYDEVYEGTVTGYFMGMQKMSREDAETAATEHLSKMPAWVCHQPS